MNYLRLCNDAQRHYLNLQKKLKHIRPGDYSYIYSEIIELTDSQVCWLKYFLEIECNEYVFRYYSSDDSLSKSEICKSLDISVAGINDYLNGAFKVVSFCREYLWDYEFKSLKDRLINKEYSKIFVSELLADEHSERAFTLHLSSFKRGNVITLDDLLKRGADDLVKIRGISKDTLYTINDKLVCLGFDKLFCVDAKEEEYKSAIVNADSKDEAVNVLLSILTKRGYKHIVSTYKNCWVKE